MSCSSTIYILDEHHVEKPNTILIADKHEIILENKINAKKWKRSQAIKWVKMVSLCSMYSLCNAEMFLKLVYKPDAMSWSFSLVLWAVSLA